MARQRYGGCISSASSCCVLAGRPQHPEWSPCGSAMHSEHCMALRGGGERWGLSWRGAAYRLPDRHHITRSDLFVALMRGHKLIPMCLCCRFAISQHPEVEERVVAELAQHGLLATEDDPNPRTLAYPDLGKLTYLQAVIKVRPSTCRGRLQLPD